MHRLPIFVCHCLHHQCTPKAQYPSLCNCILTAYYLYWQEILVQYMKIAYCHVEPKMTTNKRTNISHPNDHNQTTMATMSILSRKQSILIAATIARRTIHISSFTHFPSCQAFVPNSHQLRPNHRLTTRQQSSTSYTETTISLPSKTGPRNGLQRHTILADDSHPLRLYSRSPSPNAKPWLQDAGNERSILLLHGRTWSSQPVFDLRTSEEDEKQQSVLQSLTDLGFRVYALDLRGE